MILNIKLNHAIDLICSSCLEKSYEICENQHLNRVHQKGIGNRLAGQLLDLSTICCCSKANFLMCLESHTCNQCKPVILDWIRSKNGKPINSLFNDCQYCYYSVRIY